MTEAALEKRKLEDSLYRSLICEKLLLKSENDGESKIIVTNRKYGIDYKN